MAVTLKRIIGFLGHPRQTLAFRSKPLVTPCLQRWHAYLISRKVNFDFLAQRPPHAYPPDYSDFWFLYKTVRKRKPRAVLEFGSGVSTVVLAQALHDNSLENGGHKGFLYSIDDKTYWADVTRSIIPPALSEFCEIWDVPTLEIEYNSIPCFRHSRLPDIVPDMIYLDGPSFTRERKIAVDVLDMEDKLPADFTLIIDGREKNTEFLRTHLKRPYVFKHRIWYYNTVVTPK